MGEQRQSSIVHRSMAEGLTDFLPIQEITTLITHSFMNFSIDCDTSQTTTGTSYT